MTRGLLLLLLLSACVGPGPGSDEPLPESDAHAVLDPNRDLFTTLDDGQVLRLTDLPGAEDGEALSPDGLWMAFVGGATGIASVWVVRVPTDGGPVSAPIQLTNVDLEHAARRPGHPPEGFVPPPDLAPLRWADDRTIVWTARGVEHRVELPR